MTETLQFKFKKEIEIRPNRILVGCQVTRRTVVFQLLDGNTPIELFTPHSWDNEYIESIDFLILKTPYSIRLEARGSSEQIQMLEFLATGLINANSVPSGIHKN